MSITYTYEIVSVNEAARCMEVVYTSQGRQTMHIGARLPYEGEAVAAVVEMYAPVAYWREQEASVVVPALGGGEVVVPDPEPPTPPSNDELRKVAYREESDPLFFKWQRGEATEQEWLDKIAEIKARYPEEQNAAAE